MRRIAVLLGMAALLAVCWWAATRSPESELAPADDEDMSGRVPVLIVREEAAADEAAPPPKPANERADELEDIAETAKRRRRWQPAPEPKEPLREGVITGRVWEADGRPAVGVPVNAVPETHPIGAWGKSVTREDGTFRLARLDDDRDYRVRTDYARGEGRKDLLRVHSPIVRAGAKEVELQLIAPAWIRGHTRDGKGNPLAGISVTAFPAVWDPGREGQMARSGADGAFELGPLFPGDYRVSARSKDPRVRRTEQVLIEAPAGDISFTLTRESNHLREGTLLGEDIANFRVVWTARDAEGRRTVAHGRVDDKGAFVIGSMKDLPGTAYFYRRGDSHYALVEGLRPGATPLTVPMQEGLPISGRIAGEPGGGVYVNVRSSDLDLQRHARVGKDGQFHVKGLPPGNYELRLWATGTPEFGPALSVTAGTEGVTLEGPGRVR